MCVCVCVYVPPPTSVVDMIGNKEFCCVKLVLINAIADVSLGCGTEVLSASAAADGANCFDGGSGNRPLGSYDPYYNNLYIKQLLQKRNKYVRKAVPQKLKFYR